MTLGFVYWLILIIWALFAAWWGFRSQGDRNTLPGALVLFVLFVILGVRLFGWPISG